MGTSQARAPGAVPDEGVAGSEVGRGMRGRGGSAGLSSTRQRPHGSHARSVTVRAPLVPVATASGAPQWEQGGTPPVPPKVPAMTASSSSENRLILAATPLRSGALGAITWVRGTLTSLVHALGPGNGGSPNPQAAPTRVSRLRLMRARKPQAKRGLPVTMPVGSQAGAASASGTDHFPRLLGQIPRFS